MPSGGETLTSERLEGSFEASVAGATLLSEWGSVLETVARRRRRRRCFNHRAPPINVATIQHTTTATTMAMMPARLRPSLVAGALALSTVTDCVVSRVVMAGAAVFDNEAASLLDNDIVCDVREPVDVWCVECIKRSSLAVDVSLLVARIDNVGCWSVDGGDGVVNKDVVGVDGEVEDDEDVVVVAKFAGVVASAAVVVAIVVAAVVVVVAVVVVTICVFVNGTDGGNKGL
mmetsp:Transcript_19008/g.32762  ORF Transcript_19008/g.32762 Transcript_19008/m.32762 type:complete len:231 (-) Transcript_19008:512-1204(-)